MSKKALVKGVAVMLVIFCGMLVSCGNNDSDKPAVTTDTTNNAESVVSGDITDPVHTETDGVSGDPVTDNGGLYITGGNADLGEPDDKGESPSGDHGDTEPAVTVNTEQKEEKPVVTDGKGNASSNGNDGTTTKPTTTTKPLIQVLPDGGILLPDDVWE